jgi:prepilin signal peptidase PulO-like enzyme (type II secretory pathway)
MNAVLDTLNTVMDAVIGALGVALAAVARAALANVHAAEWSSALVLALAVWLLAGRRWRPAVGLGLFVLAVGAGAWLSWKTGHTGVTAQQAALAALVLRGQLKAQGWALVKKS